MVRNILFFFVCLILMIIMKYLWPTGDPVFGEILLSSSLFSFFLTLFYIYINRRAAQKSNST